MGKMTPLDRTMIIMIGLQGSGKSEYCRQFLPEYTRVNLDTLRTRNNESRMLDKCFAKGISFVVDNTNPTRAERARYTKPAQERGYHIIGIFMESKLKECILRNNLREGKARIGAKAIAATSNKLEMPGWSEGFDELFFVHNDGTTMTMEVWRDTDGV